MTPEQSAHVTHETQLGKYRLVDVIHAGPMSTVYRAVDGHLGREVAIKTLAPHLASDTESVHRFLNEARLVSRLRHPNIVTIYEVDVAAGRHFIVMELLRGPTLARRLAGDGAIDPARACAIVRQIADALDHAHVSGLVHRDIKPANITVEDDGHVILMDFGLVKGELGTRLTQAGTTLGTPAYMSPEQVQGLEATASSDLYALGAVAFEMLTGRLPFEREMAAAIMYAHVHEPVPSVRDLIPSLSPAVDRVIKRALAKSPAARWPSAGAFAEALCAAVQVAPAIVSSPGWSGWRPVALGGAGGIVAIGLLVTLAPRVTESVRGVLSQATVVAPTQSASRSERPVGGPAVATDIPRVLRPTDTAPAPPTDRPTITPAPTSRSATAVTAATPTAGIPTVAPIAPTSQTEPGSGGNSGGGSANSGSGNQATEPPSSGSGGQSLPPIGGQAPPTKERPPPDDPPRPPEPTGIP